LHRRRVVHVYFHVYYRKEIGGVAVDALVGLLVGEQNVLVAPDGKRREAQQHEAKGNEKEDAEAVLDAVPASRVQQGKHKSETTKWKKYKGEKKKKRRRKESLRGHSEVRK
jgi:hypothetical protein